MPRLVSPAIEGSLEGSRFAELLVRMHGRAVAARIVRGIVASQWDAGRTHSADNWRQIEVEVQRHQTGTARQRRQHTRRDRKSS